MDGDNITLDKDSFKALAVDTRINVLKLLHDKPHTLSELSDELGLSNPTVKEHLEILERAELIARHDEGRKWKYYKLTRKGLQVINPKEVRVFFSFIVMLIASVGIAMALVWQLFSRNNSTVIEAASKTAPVVQNTRLLAAQAVPTAVHHSILSALNILSAVLIIAIVITIILLFLYFRLSKKSLLGGTQNTPKKNDDAEQVNAEEKPVKAKKQSSKSARLNKTSSKTKEKKNTKATTLKKGGSKIAKKAVVSSEDNKTAKK